MTTPEDIVEMIQELHLLKGRLEDVGWKLSETTISSDTVFQIRKEIERAFELKELVNSYFGYLAIPKQWFNFKE